MVRDKWLCLNGTWQFRFDPRDIGVDDQWQRPNAAFDKSIVVPFCWESKLSGVKDLTGQKIGWYRRTVEVPADWKDQRVWLRFEAVDWEARVWVNGVEVGKHEGGYTPFELDITDQAAPGSTVNIVVRAFDPTDKSLPTGKQVFWYTPTSGIWQSVWLEPRPRTHIADLKLTPKKTQTSWTLTAEAQVQSAATGNFQVRFRSADRSVARTSTAVEVGDAKNPAARGGAAWAGDTLAIREPRLWTPEDPILYDLDIEVADDAGVIDVVHTYFGLRTIERGKVGNRPYESILLNGKPIYLRGALDQSFNPDGIYTAPTDDFLRKDMELSKRLGLNYLRIHIKPEEPRRLYWADRLGVLIMQDMPNTWVYSKPGQQAWEATMRGAIARDRNHPSIVAWCLFNESWGVESPADSKGRHYRDNPDRQNWVAEMFRIAKTELDPTRLIEDMSPDKRDHVLGDFNSWHFYIDDYPQARKHIDDVVKQTFPGSPFNYAIGRKQDTAPLMNSEYGSVSAGGGDRDVSWGFRHLTTQLRRHEKIQGYVYTELSDIEWEHNGFVNYDRTPKQFGYDAFVPGMSVADLQGADFIGFDASPAIVTKPGETVRVPIFLSHYSKLTSAPAIRWYVVGFDDLGNEHKTRPLTVRANWDFATVTEQPAIEATIPTNRPFVGALAMELVDEGGRRIAGNFVNLISRPDRAAGQPVSPRVDVLAPTRVALRFAPDDFASANGASVGRYGIGHGKFYAFGGCEVEYRIHIPKEVIDAEPVGLEFMAELASKAGAERLDWPSRTSALDYPQTDRDGFASMAELHLGGKNVALLKLKDDPADARGVLSHEARFHHGSYGELLREKIDTANNPEILTALRNGQPFTVKFRVTPGPLGKGLSVYGESTGRYPVDPTLIVTTRKLLPRSIVDPMKSLTRSRYQDRFKQAIATGEQGAGHRWRYTDAAPAGEWQTPDFDDSAWKTGAGGFGSRGTPGVGIGTRWRSKDIWMRTTFELPKKFEGLSIRLFHDEDVEIYLNGKPFANQTGFVAAYEQLDLSAEQIAQFQPGKNTIAVHCRQTTGGQGVDIGIDYIVP